MRVIMLWGVPWVRSNTRTRRGCFEKTLEMTSELEDVLWRSCPEHEAVSMVLEAWFCKVGVLETEEERVDY